MLPALTMEEGASSQDMQAPCLYEVSGSWRGRKWTPLESPEGASPGGASSLAQGDPFLTAVLQNRKTISGCCLNHQFVVNVTAATGNKCTRWQQKSPFLFRMNFYNSRKESILKHVRLNCSLTCLDY